MSIGTIDSLLTSLAVAEHTTAPILLPQPCKKRDKQTIAFPPNHMGLRKANLPAIHSF